MRLDNAQHGFRVGRSTATNHINFINYSHSQLDTGRQVDTAYFDIQKAFDRVDNDVLLGKLSAIGFTPKSLQLFASYLADRQQYVQLAGYKSQSYYTRSGVSQGSTLGPILFLIMVNDLPQAIKSAKCLMFADDLKLYIGVGSVCDCEALQNDISNVIEWGDRNHLQFNEKKCRVMTYTKSRTPIQHSYQMLGNTLTRVHEMRDLGVTFDPRLNFREHIVAMTKVANRTLGFIIRQTHIFQDCRPAIMLYNAYVRSRLEYNALIWDPYEAKYKLLIEKIHKKFCRYIYKKKYGYYPFLYPSLFVTGMLGFDTLELRRSLQAIIHFYHLLTNKIDNPSALTDVSLNVPMGAMRGAGELGLRRRRPLLAAAGSRTRATRNATTRRTVALLNSILLTQDVDLFTDKLYKIISAATVHLTHCHTNTN